MATGIEYLGDFSRYAVAGESQGSIEHIAKRRRVNDQYEKFGAGSIIRVRVKNFTTYSYAEFNLSPRLNMIIGPNGSGKSTLVAAICLGLGGRIALIKRKTMKSMIKTGQDRAEIEITLKNKSGSRPQVIKRSFTDKESQWTINGRPGIENDVKRICQKLNIQLNNLCHFLPQERVAEFAGLSPEKLLIEIERTLGDGHLLAMHEELIELDVEGSEIASKIENTSTELENLREQREKLESEAQKYREYQEKTKELKYHQMLVPYAQLQDLKSEQKHLKYQRDATKRELDRFTSKADSFLSEKRRLMPFHDEVGRTINSYKTAIREVQAKGEDTQKELEEIKTTINSLVSTRDVLKTRTSEKKNELQLLKEERENLKNRFNSLRPVDESAADIIRSEREDLLRSSKHIKDSIEKIRDDINPKLVNLRRLEVKIEQHRKTLNSKDKLNILKPNERSNNRFREEVYLGHKLLREKNEFSYFESPLITCDIPQQKYACYLEKVIDNNTLFSITLTSKEEYEKVADFVLNKYNVPIRLINSLVDPRNPLDKDTLRKLGFDGYLSDFISGPPEVLSMLYNTSRIDTIPVSYSGLSNQQIQYLTTPNAKQQMPFKRFISGDTLFNIHRSQYGSRQFFYSTERINPKLNFFGTSGLSLEQKREIEDQIREMESQHKELEISVKEMSLKEKEKVKALETEGERLTVLRRELDLLERDKSKIASVSGLIKAKDEQIERLELQAERDYTNRIKDINRKVSQKYNMSAKMTAKKCNFLKEETELSISMNQETLKFLDIRNRIAALETLLADFDEYRRNLALDYEEAKRKYNQIKKSGAAQKIKEQSERYTDEEKAILSELATQYVNEQHFTENYINEKIQLIKDERSLMSTADQSSIENLSQKIEAIGMLESDLPKLINQKKSVDAKITKIREEWEPELESLIQKISLAFNKRFTKVASDGNVELFKSEKFKDWKLQILVKFRQESQLKILDNQSQSGGERAVSTIFFIMSLQGLTDAPFRVVDEINQGMDQKNEKAAHRYFVHTACQTANSQYFLVTPKLLTGLYYHPDMMVHCIFTGALLPPVEEDSSKPGLLEFSRTFGT